MNYGFNALIVLHLSAAVAAIAVGALAFAARKGSVFHRVAGRGWVALMLVTALSSFWIRTTGSFSWIHLLSVAVPVLLAASVYAAIRGNVARHRLSMISIYALGLGVAGLFTLLPDRLLGRMLWSSVGLL